VPNVKVVDREIIINSAPYETRVALIEGRRAVEVFIERRRDRGVTGNIYKGKVTRVLPGMQAAFVDIGLPRAAYLHGSDVDSPLQDEVPGHGDAPLELVGEPAAGRRTRPQRGPIEDRLKSGQEILVQVVKPPVGTKGARVTSMISLPGRHLVFTPLSRRIGVSRRIDDEEERRRLKELVEGEHAEGGFIIRTACAGLTKREIQADVRFLMKLWRRILEKSEHAGSSALLHYDMDLVLRTVRDLFAADTRRLIVDDPAEYERINDFLDTVTPKLRSRVQLYDDSQPIFERFGIEPQIGKALDRKVWLKSGGYIVIDQTEALTVVDVNTGRFVGKRNQEETVLKTNLEAVKTLLEQLRLRGIGGLIVIDLIDMEDPASQRLVFDALREGLRRDKSRSKLLPISELGLIEMTRKRTRVSLADTLCEPCSSCGARARIKSKETVAYEILRRVRREAASNGSVTEIRVAAHPEVAAFLNRNEADYLRSFEASAGKRVTVTAEASLATTAYRLTAAEAAA
jgi:ribonuclease G